MNRRDFFKKGSLAVAATAMPALTRHHAPAPTETSKQPGVFDLMRTDAFVEVQDMCWWTGHKNAFTVFANRDAVPPCLVVTRLKPRHVYDGDHGGLAPSALHDDIHPTVMSVLVRKPFAAHEFIVVTPTPRTLANMYLHLLDAKALGVPFDPKKIKWGNNIVVSWIAATDDPHDLRDGLLYRVARPCKGAPDYKHLEPGCYVRPYRTTTPVRFDPETETLVLPVVASLDNVGELHRYTNPATA